MLAERFRERTPDGLDRSLHRSKLRAYLESRVDRVSGCLGRKRGLCPCGRHDDHCGSPLTDLLHAFLRDRGHERTTSGEIYDRTTDRLGNGYTTTARGSRPEDYPAPYHEDNGAADNDCRDRDLLTHLGCRYRGLTPLTLVSTGCAQELV
jgi:hypothetical protein